MHNNTAKSLNNVTFEEAINNTLPEDRFLLLGNGFSKSLCSYFDYKTLYDTATKLNINNKLSTELLSIFNDLQTDDFEKVLAHLNVAKRITNHYKNELSQIIDTDIKLIRRSFINSITKVHPSIDKLGDETKLSVCKFLSKFSKIFTTNYDLLLYWIFMLGKSSCISCPHDDGFRHLIDNQYSDELVWSTSKEQNLYYLHGALHFFDNEQGNVFKLRRENNIPLISQIVQRISNGFYPLVVFEGKHEQKLEKIKSHEYLLHSYNTLKNTKGSLFTLGASLNEYSDYHIINAIKNSQFNQVFIGLYKGNAILHEKGFSLRNESRKVDFFDSETAINWVAVEKESQGAY